MSERSERIGWGGVWLGAVLRCSPGGRTGEGRSAVLRGRYPSIARISRTAPSSGSRAFSC